MAEVKLNPLITSAHGRIGGEVYYCRYGRHFERVYVRGRNPDTEAQRAVRRTFGDAVRSWQALPCDEKHKYNKKAVRLNMSGYNLYISGYMKTAAGAVLNAGKKQLIDLKQTGKYPLSNAYQIPFSSVSPPFTSLSGNKISYRSRKAPPL